MGEKRKKQVQWIVFFICIFAVMGILMYASLTKIKLEGASYYKERMISVVQDQAEKINIELEKMEAAGKTAAHMLAASDTPSEHEIGKAILAVQSGTTASRVIYCEDSTGWEWDEEALRETDLKEYSFYDDLQNAEEVTYIPSVGENGTDAIILVIPIDDDASRSLLLFYSMEEMNELLKISKEYEANSFIVLLDADGVIITRSDYESSFLTDTFFWGNISQEYQDEITRTKIQILNQTCGSVKAVSADAQEEKMLVYVPTQKYGWCIIAGLDQKLVQRKEMNYWKSSASMVYQIIGVLFFFALVLLIFNYISNKKNDETDRILREKADTDLLTGLNNKLATERKIKEYMEQNPDSMAMMFVLDIDNFKKINDTMGHAFGDEVLKTLGRTLSPIFRVTDIVGRTGGDEFTIFLKFLQSEDNTLKEAKKLVNFFKDFTAGEYVKYSATASIGAAVFPTDGKDFETLYKAADKALYKAKKRGKNQLAFYDDRDRTDVNETEKEEQP